MDREGIRSIRLVLAMGKVGGREKGRRVKR